MAKTECAICEKEVQVLDEFNGEMMCEACYLDPENNVFGEEIKNG